MLVGDSDTQARSFIVQLQVAVLGFGIAFENVVEELVSDFHVENREILRDRAIRVGHRQMIIVHLSRMRYRGDLARLGDRIDLLRCRDSADAVRVVLQNAYAFETSKSLQPMIENSCSPPEIGTMFIAFNSRYPSKSSAITGSSSQRGSYFANLGSILLA